MSIATCCWLAETNLFVCEPGEIGEYSDLLLVKQSGARIPIDSRLSVPV